MKSSKRLSSLILSCLLSATLVACGGGGGASSTGGGGAGSQPVADEGENGGAVSDAQIIALVTSSNIQMGIPTSAGWAGTWRWPNTPTQPIAVYIPAGGNATEQDYAAKTRSSIATINQKLAGLVVLEAVSAIPASGNYIRVGYGTAYVPPGSTDYRSYCANVSTGPNVGNPIQPDASGAIATNPVYVNLGNGNCDVTQDIVTHEVGHALGLSGHFSGFGNGAAISPTFWDVLATLYANPPLTAPENLTVRRAAN